MALNEQLDVGHDGPGHGTHDAEFLTRELAEQIAGAVYEDISLAARTVAAQCVMDGIGVSIAALDEPGVRILRDAVASEAESGPSVILGTKRTASARNAALVNGNAAHALDFDDVSAMMGGHPTVPVLPAALAVAEVVGATGRDLIRAMAVGVECEARVGGALGEVHYTRGFHTTATAGSVGAAAASASLLGLSTNQTAVALGISATQASGLKTMFGTMCKPLHAGLAATAGVLAADLAVRGFTSSKRSLEDKQGMLQVMSDAPDFTDLAAPFGGEWAVADILFKFHAACYLTHSTIESVLQLRSEGLAADQVDAIEIVVPRGHMGVCAIPAPVTGLEGKFSLAHVTALALTRGRVSEQEFTDELANDREIVALRERIQVTPSDEMSRLSSRVTAYTRDGQGWQASLDVGTPSWHESPEEQTAPLQAKFDALVGPKLGCARSRELLDMLVDLENLHSVRDLTRLTQPAC